MAMSLLGVRNLGGEVALVDTYSSQLLRRERLKCGIMGSAICLLTSKETHYKQIMSDPDFEKSKEDKFPGDDAVSNKDETEVISENEEEACSAPNPDQEEAAQNAAADAHLRAGSSNVLGRGKLSARDEKIIGMLVHLLGGVTYILGPLVIWLIKKDESPFVKDQGREAMNFQITMIIGFAIATATAFFPFVGSCLSPLLWLSVGVANLIFAILGGLEANKGIIYRYPFALRLIKE